MQTRLGAGAVDITPISIGPGGYPVELHMLCVKRLHSPPPKSLGRVPNNPSTIRHPSSNALPLRPQNPFNWIISRHSLVHGYVLLSVLQRGGPWKMGNRTVSSRLPPNNASEKDPIRLQDRHLQLLRLPRGHCE